MRVNKIVQKSGSYQWDHIENEVMLRSRLFIALARPRILFPNNIRGLFTREKYFHKDLNLMTIELSVLELHICLLNKLDLLFLVFNIMSRRYQTCEKVFAQTELYIISKPKLELDVTFYNNSVPNPTEYNQCNLVMTP